MTKYRALTLSVILIIIDQLIKKTILEVLTPVGQIPVISGFFNLTYVENRGAAFGILQNHTRLLSVISLLVLIGVLVLVFTGKVKDKFLIWSLSLVAAGGAGNCIDRIVRGYVIDYLDFSALFGFPVFNFADCCVVIGTALIFIYVIRYDQKQKETAST